MMMSMFKPMELTNSKEVNSMTNVSKELVTVEDFQLLYDDEYV
jgi:hypothetical protein